MAVSDGANSDSVGIFLNTGKGTFSGSVSFPLNLTTATSLVVGDFNGDGKPDLAVLDETIGSVAVLLGNGDGTFGSPVVTALPYGGYAIASFYFSGSSYASLAAVVPDTSYPIYAALAAEVLIGQGNGTFGIGGLYPAVGFDYGAGIAIADVNRDGLPDLVVGAFCDDPATDASCTRGEVSVLLGIQDGSFTPPRTTVVQDGNLWGVTMADLNGDGAPDITASTLTGVLVSFGNGDGTFQAQTIYAGLQNLSGTQTVVDDLNGDGLPDILQPANYDQLAILYNQGVTNPRSVVTIQSSLEPSTFGQSTTLTSSVTSKVGLATGNISFKDGTANLGTESLVSGSASLTTARSGAGVHSLSAAYSGNGTVPAGNSAGFYQLVNQATSSVTLKPSVDPSYVNQTVSFTATVSSQYGGAVTGNVRFQEGTSTLGTVAVSHGRAIFQKAFTTKGQYAITATYSGDTNNLSAASSALTQSVKPLPAATITKLASSGTPAFVGQPVTFTSTTTSTDGTVTDGVTVTFLDGSIQIGTATTTGGVDGSLPRRWPSGPTRSTPISRETACMPPVPGA